jgi:hypothetical protein
VCFELYFILLVVTYEGCWKTTSSFYSGVESIAWDLDCETALYTFQLDLFKSASLFLLCSDLRYSFAACDCIVLHDLITRGL